MKKNILATSLSAALFLGVGVLSVYAQAYQPLAPLPQTFDPSTKTTNIEMYLSGAIKLIIALGAALSILFAIIAGTRYVAASINPVVRQGALEQLQNSLVGLGIILTSYLLLNSINPKLVEVGFNLQPIKSETVSLNSLIVRNSSDGGLTTGVFAGISEDWGSDQAIRTTLSNSGIAVKSPSCTKTGEKDCTSVLSLGSTAVNGLIKFKSLCNCEVMVTGGTEFWLHSAGTAHRPENNVVDLRKGNALDAKIMTSGIFVHEAGAGICSSLGRAWRFPPTPDGGVYVDEGNHWHVCY